MSGVVANLMLLMTLVGGAEPEGAASQPVAPAPVRVGPIHVEMRVIQVRPGVVRFEQVQVGQVGQGGQGGVLREAQDGPAEPSGPSTRPDLTAKPSITLDEARVMLEGLSQSDGAVREDATQKLLALRRPDLPVLLDAARGMSPMLPEAIEPLRSAVAHIFLTGEPYEALLNTGFLGINLNPIALPTGAGGVGTGGAPGEARGEARGEAPGEPLGGVVGREAARGMPSELGVQGIAVTNRVPGVAGFQYLQEGDVIVAVNGKGDFRGTEDFTMAVRGHKPGVVVNMRLLRGGRAMDVAIPLSPRPVRMEELNALDVLRNQRENAARTHWESQWAAVVGGESVPEPGEDAAGPTTRPGK